MEGYWHIFTYQNKYRDLKQKNYDCGLEVYVVMSISSFHHISVDDGFSY